MKNEELLICITSKFDEVHGRISKIDKNMSKIWANTVCQYILLAICLICFLVYNYKIENITQRIDVLFDKVNTHNSVTISNESNASNSNKNSKTSNNTDNQKNTSLFGK